MFLTFWRYLPAFSTVWTFSTTFFDYISRLLQTVIRSQPSVPAITLRDAWPLTTQQIYRYSSNFLDSVDEDAVRALGTQHHPQRLQCKIRDRQRGSFNACFFLEFSDGSARVVRLPLDPAVQDAWDKVRSEVYTMQFLRRHTNIPIPQVYTYGRSQLCRHTPEPQVFMIMEQVEGQQLTTETLSTSPESHRRRFLQQLVDVFVELRRLPFAQGGSLLPSNSEDLESPPDIVGAFSIRKNELQAVGYRVSRTIAANARDFLDEQLRVLRCIWTMPYKELDYQQAEREEFSQKFLSQSGIQDRVHIGSTAATELFFLAHPDLHIRNILVDNELNICGIIDWEYTTSVPQCVFAPPLWIISNTFGPAGLSEFMAMLSSMKDKSSYHFQLAADWVPRDLLTWSLCYILADPGKLEPIFWDMVMPYITGLCDIPVPDNMQLQADVNQRLEVAQRFAKYLDDNNLNVEGREEEMQRILLEAQNYS